MYVTATAPRAPWRPRFGFPRARFRHLTDLRGISRVLLGLVVAFLFLATAAPASAQNSEPLTIDTAAGPQRFSVQVARDDADRAQGLMFRRSLAPDRGMLFDFAQVEPVSMWMKNTYLSLDMLFIRPDGTISHIAENAEPLSTRVIPSGGPVLAVLEVNAGTAKRLGIKPGDRVEHPLFKRQ
jgi:uncharacterized membrane protein (UPF0127 family)